MVRIKKRNGNSEEYIPEKIVVSCIKCGATPQAAREISKVVERKLKDGINSEELRAMVLEQLRSKNL